jgi:hypothetical protein
LLGGAIYGGYQYYKKRRLAQQLQQLQFAQSQVGMINTEGLFLGDTHNQIVYLQNLVNVMGLIGDQIDILFLEAFYGTPNDDAAQFQGASANQIQQYLVGRNFNHDPNQGHYLKQLFDLSASKGFRIIGIDARRPPNVRGFAIIRWRTGAVNDTWWANIEAGIQNQGGNPVRYIVFGGQAHRAGLSNRRPGAMNYYMWDDVNHTYRNL